MNITNSSSYLLLLSLFTQTLICGTLADNITTLECPLLAPQKSAINSQISSLSSFSSIKLLLSEQHISICVCYFGFGIKIFKRIVWAFRTISQFLDYRDLIRCQPRKTVTVHIQTLIC